MNKGHRFGSWYAFKTNHGVYLSWLVFCSKCGLVRLRNPRTAAAIKAVCPGDGDD